MRLKEGYTTEDVIEQFESMYGVVETRASLVLQCYGARQKEHEDITTWTPRIEDLLNKLIKK